jgi:hypothetical protein
MLTTKNILISGADYVEPDVVLSKDGILVCFHDIALKQITDVESHPQFLHLRGNYTIIVDGEEENLINDYLVVNFTLAELKTLTLNQRQKGVRLQYFNGLFPIPTFQEFIDSVHKISSELAKPIGSWGIIDIILAPRIAYNGHTYVCFRYKVLRNRSLRFLSHLASFGNHRNHSRD